MLIILRGYSGSGKSTKARAYAQENPDTVIVSRDSFRAMLTGNPAKTVLDQKTENLITKMQETAVRESLRAGKTVIVDDTNLRLKYARRWADIAVQEGVERVVWDVTTDAQACLRQNAGRLNLVPHRVIEDQARRFPMPWPTVVPSTGEFTFKPYVPDTSKPTAFGFDLDGTLALFDGTRGPYDTHLYHTDRVNETLREIMWSLKHHNILIMTGRSEDHRDVVEQWLGDNRIYWDDLFMRKSGDTRNDAIVKSELFDEFVAPYYNFLAQFDDRDRVVAALRAKGIPVYQVAPGNF